MTNRVPDRCIRIVTWNCREKFHEKFEKIKELKADVYVIQECNPTKEQISGYSQAAWSGTKRKGVGIFVRNELELEDKECSNENRVYNGGFYVSCRIKGGPNILGIWAWHSRDSKKNIKDYSKDLLSDLKTYEEKINGNYIIAGDFNMDESNWRPEIIQILKEKGLVSAYHKFFSTKFGDESDMTHYTKRKTIQADDHEIVRYKPSTHIDYVFVNENHKIEVKIQNPDYWIYEEREWIRKNGKWESEEQYRRSDHVPIVVDIRL